MVQSNIRFLETKQVLVIAGLIAGFLSGCAGDSSNRMSPDELFASIQNGTAPVVVDVRTESEYKAGHVPGALHIPFYAVWTRHSEIRGSNEESVILYCAHGPRAGVAKFGLWTMGFKHIQYLEGHMSAWKKRGLPVVKDSP